MTNVTPLVAYAITLLSVMMEYQPEGFRDFVQTRSVDELKPSYDFIVVGGGSAGCVVANRLSENPNWNVLLIEAGGQENYWSKTPFLYDALEQSKFSWNYTTVRQERACLASGGICKHPRGKVLGGSAAIGAAIHLRNYRSDYDAWGVDNSGWSYKDVLPYFKKSESSRSPGLQNRGKDGPLPVTYLNYYTEIGNDIIQAGQELGWSYSDCQEYEDECIQYQQYEMFRGRIWSSSAAYLEPISHERKNLDILTNARVTKLLINNDGTVSGVLFRNKGKPFTKHANKEVILCAGAIDSPKILMLSGIGPRGHLNSLGIGVIRDLPVGENLQDHIAGKLTYQVSRGTITVNDIKKGERKYLEHQTGPQSSTGVEILAMNREGSRIPNIRHEFDVLSRYNNDQITSLNFVSRPESRGTIRLASDNYKDDPLIDFNYYSSPKDYKLAVKAMLEAHKLMQSNLLRSYTPELMPEPLCASEKPIKKYVKCAISVQDVLSYNPVGSVKMGPPENGGVVNNKLQVYGIKKLRVIDASIAPLIPSMNTNAMTVMIGEKGSAIVKHDY